MRKSIFFKYFSITAAILLVSFVILGGVLMVFTRNQWTNSKSSLLFNNVYTISELSSEAVTTGSFQRQLGNTTVVIGRIIDADIYITDQKGSIILCSDESNDCVHKRNGSLSADLVKQSLAGDKTYSGTMGGMYSVGCYTVSTPITYSGQKIGAVFASVPLASADYAVLQMFKALIVCSLTVLIMAFFAIYIASAQMTRPLRQMADAARRMEQGEFVQILPIRQRDEVGLLVDAFNKMSKSLGSLEHMRRSFISNVSHELKTPMTTIAGFVDGVLDGTIPPENQQKYLQIVSDETKRLSRLVNSMLQMSRFDNNEMKLRPSVFNITEMLTRIFLSFEQRIDEKRLDIRGLGEASGITLYADEDLIYQVLYNLIENAIKFTPEQGYISVTAAAQKHSTVEIGIQNSGDGLTEVELSRIFERFYKTDRSRSNDKTGMGFGLYIVKNIVGLHGGRIVAQSVVGEYTRFLLTLPLNLQNAPPEDAHIIERKDNNDEQ